MPGCMGTAAMGAADPNSLAWCSCPRPGRGAPTLEEQVVALGERVAASNLGGGPMTVILSTAFDSEALLGIADAAREVCNAPNEADTVQTIDLLDALVELFNRGEDDG